MKFIHRKPSANFPQTPVWGITATKWAVVISFGLHSVVIELPRRKLTKRALDEGDSLAESELSNDEIDTDYEVWANL